MRPTEPPEPEAGDLVKPKATPTPKPKKRSN
jgi:hypothetical protein